MRLAGFFSTKLRDRQVTWLPCEIEALAIAAATKHFSPCIIQSQAQCMHPNRQHVYRHMRSSAEANSQLLHVLRLSCQLSTVSRFQVLDT